MWNLVPVQESNLGPLHWEKSLATGLPGKFQDSYVFIFSKGMPFTGMQGRIEGRKEIQFLEEGTEFFLT